VAALRRIVPERLRAPAESALLSRLFAIGKAGSGART